jgi:hypothetical protein
MFTNTRSRCFTSDEDGSATLEFTLWMPVFAILLLLIADTSLLFSAKANLWRVASDTARRIAVGELTTVTAPAYAQAQLGGNPDYVVRAMREGRDVKVGITVPFGEIAMSAAIFPAETTMSVAVIQRVEQ